jgi:type II secretory pathway pseudopilin PulG
MMRDVMTTTREGEPVRHARTGGHPGGALKSPDVPLDFRMRGNDRSVTHRARTSGGFTLIELVVVIGIIILLVALTAAVSTSLIARSEIQRTQTTLTVLETALDDWRVSNDREITLGNDSTVGGVAVSYDLQLTSPHLMSVSELLCVIGRTPSFKTILAQIPDEQQARYDTGGTVIPGWLTPDPDDPDPNAGATVADFNALATSNPGVEVIVILDAWETPIRLIHPGRVRDSLVPLAGPSAIDPLPGTWPDWTKVGNAPAGAPKEDDGTVFLTDVPPFTGMEEFYGMARNRKICFVSAGPDRKFGNVSAAFDTDLYQQSRDNLYSYEVIRP